MVVVYHTEAATATFLSSSSWMLTGSPSDATLNLRMASLDSTAIRYLLFQENVSDVRLAASAEACYSDGNQAPQRVGKGCMIPMGVARDGLMSCRCYTN